MVSLSKQIWEASVSATRGMPSGYGSLYSAMAVTSESTSLRACFCVTLRVSWVVFWNPNIMHMVAPALKAGDVLPCSFAAASTYPAWRS